MRKTENIINRTGINKTECKKTGHSKENKIPGVKCTPKIELYLSNFKGALHWWNGSLFFLIIILGITLGIFAGCKNIFVPEPPATPEAAGPGGGITVSLRLFTGSARSVMPGMEALNWKITASQGDITISVAKGAYPEFSLSLPVSGTWTFTVRGINSANDEIFTGSAEQNIESGSTVSISIPLSPGSGMGGDGATGDLNLTIKPENVNSMSLKYRIDGSEEWWSPVSLDGGDYTISGGSLFVGQHTLDLYFSSNSDKGKFYFCTVAVNIWPGMTSDQWIKTSGEEYINDNGEFVITVDMVNEFVKTMGSVVFVNANVDADTPATGSFFAPVNSVSTAVDILRKANPGGNYNGTIMVSGATTIDKAIDVKNGETLTVKGTGADASIENTSGRVFNIASGGSLTLEENITLTGTNDAGNGGAVYVNGGNFIMKNGSKITGSSAQNGGGVYIAGGTFTMNGTAILQGNMATTHGGGVHIFSGGTFTMNGGTIDGTTEANTANNANLGGGVFVSDGTFNMNDGTISGNTVTQSGGGVYVYETGKFTMKGGTIGGSDGASANSSESGGGVCVYKGDFTMSDGSISGNTVTQSGGGVYVGDGTFTMYGGTIGGTTGNTATDKGGGVYVDGTSSIFFMQGNGTITNNTANLGCGVYVGSSGSFGIGEPSTASSPVVSGNTKNGSSPNNVYLDTGKTLSITGKLKKKTEESGNIGITMATPGVFTSDWSSSGLSDSTFFFSDDESYKIVLNSSGECKLETNDSQVEYKVSGITCSGTFADAIDAVNTAAGGTITLLKDIDSSNAVFGTNNKTPITFTGGTEANPIILDLNGFTINRGLDAAQANGSVIKIEGGNLSIKDSSATNPDGTSRTGTITGGNSTTNGGGICIENNGSLTLENGWITGNKTGGDGGGVYFSSNGTFTMSGGSIKSNVASNGSTNGNGGGVCLKGGTFTMSGTATIANNEAVGGSSMGGGIYLDGGTLTMTGNAAITGNQASKTSAYGGGIYLNSGTFNMKDGEITGNKAGRRGGGVYFLYKADDGPIFNLGDSVNPDTGTDPVIRNNTNYSDNANNVYVESGALIEIVGDLRQNGETEENIGITKEKNTGNFAKKNGHNVSVNEIFSSDQSGYRVDMYDDKFNISSEY